jgi:hypothetical protein
MLDDGLYHRRRAMVVNAAITEADHQFHCMKASFLFCCDGNLSCIVDSVEHL